MKLTVLSRSLKKKSRPCIFEYIYFARPDSIIDGKCAYEFRKKFGEICSKGLSSKGKKILSVTVP